MKSVVAGGQPIAASRHVDACFAYPACHVVYTSPQAERAARDGIKAAGFETYLPVERASKLVRRRRVEIERPLFSRYLFVSIERWQDWSALLEVDGVEDVLRNNDVPSRVPSAWIDMLRKLEGAGAFDRRPHVKPPFAIDEIVRISEGPFSGLQAQIKQFVTKLTSAQAHRRVKILLDFLGRQTAMEMDVVALEKI